MQLYYGIHFSPSSFSFPSTYAQPSFTHPSAMSLLAPNSRGCCTRLILFSSQHLKD